MLVLGVPAFRRSSMDPYHDLGEYPPKTIPIIANTNNQEIKRKHLQMPKRCFGQGKIHP